VTGGAGDVNPTTAVSISRAERGVGRVADDGGHDAQDFLCIDRRG
jgi:hypothetical protein